MTALVLENFAAWPFYARSLRTFLARVARALDALVSARFARQVPEWRMREVQSEINRYCGLIRAGELQPEKKAKSTLASNGAVCFNLG